MRKVLILQQGACRGEVVCQGEGCFAVVKPKPKQEDLLGLPRQRKNATKDNSRIRLGEGC